MDEFSHEVNNCSLRQSDGDSSCCTSSSSGSRSISSNEAGVFPLMKVHESGQHQERGSGGQISSTDASGDVGSVAQGRCGCACEGGWHPQLMLGGMVETRIGMGFAAHMAAGLGCFR